MNPGGNILLIRFKSIGDILFMLPAVHAVRENFPGAKITFLTSRENAPLLRGFREVDEIITIDRARRRSGNPRKILAESFALLRRLRGGNFSLAVDFQGYGETAWLAWLSGAPHRWGSVYSPGRKWAYTRGVKRDDTLHHVDRSLALLRECGLHPGEIRNEFVLPDDALNEARRFFAAAGLDPARATLFIQPFTSSPFKNWPLDRHLAVARHGRERGLQVLFGGGPAEQPALEPVRQAGFAVSAGVPLLVTGGLMKLSALVLGGDTGALHLAVAMGKRVMMITNSTAGSSSYPFQHAEWTVTPADSMNVSDIPAEVVIQAIARAMDTPAGDAFC
jgi:ADP-heptose:LPS heptosyltransferase